MSLISLVVGLIVIGLLLWAVQQLPGNATIKNIAYVVIVVFAVLWLLQQLGLMGSVSDLQLR